MDRVKRIAEVMCLQYIQSPQQHRNIAVLVIDREDASLRIRFTADWTDCDKTTLDIVANLAADLHFRAQRLGASDFVAHLRQALLTGSVGLVQGSGCQLPASQAKG